MTIHQFPTKTTTRRPIRCETLSDIRRKNMERLNQYVYTLYRGEHLYSYSCSETEHEDGSLDVVMGG